MRYCCVGCRRPSPSLKFQVGQAATDCGAVMFLWKIFLPPCDWPSWLPKIKFSPTTMDLTGEAFKRLISKTKNRNACEGLPPLVSRRRRMFFCGKGARGYERHWKYIIPF